MKYSENTKNDYQMLKNPGLRGSVNNAVTHEAESQRQHVRVQLPAILTINQINGSTERLNIQDISASGLSFECDEHVLFKNTSSAAVRFPFEAYSLTIMVKLHVISREGRTVHARFEEIDNEAHSVLRHVLSAYIAGEIASADELIHVVSRDNFAKKRDISKKESASAFRSLFSMLLYSIVGLLAAAYLISSIYNVSFVSNSLAASIGGDTIQVNMPRGGTFHNYIKNAETVSVGQNIGGYSWVRYDEGGNAREESKIIVSPCNCFVKEHAVEDGALVGQGQNLFTFVPIDNPLFIDAQFSYKKSGNFNLGDEVSYQISGDKNRRGTIVKIKAQPETVVVRIQSEEPIDGSSFGMPVQVKVDRWNQ